jgi:hypothetical protein
MLFNLPDEFDRVNAERRDMLLLALRDERPDAARVIIDAFWPGLVGDCLDGVDDQWWESSAGRTVQLLLTDETRLGFSRGRAAELTGLALNSIGQYVARGLLRRTTHRGLLRAEDVLALRDRRHQKGRLSWRQMTLEEVE